MSTEPISDVIGKTIRLKNLLEEANTLRRTDLNRSVAISKEALNLSEDLHDSFSKAKALQTLGFCRQMQSMFAEAIESLSASAAIFAELGDKSEEAASTNFLGKVYAQLADYDEALECFYHSLRLSETINDNVNLVNSLIVVSNIEVRLNHYDKAESFLKRAIRVSEECSYKYGEALANLNLGKVYGFRGMKEKSLEMFFHALPLLEELKDKINLSTAYGNIAVSYRDVGEYEKARSFFLQALQMKAEFGDNFDNIHTYVNLAQLDQLEKKYEEGIKRLDTALTQAIEMNAVPVFPAIYKTYYSIYKEQGEIAKALEAFEKYSEKQNEHVNAENKKKASHLEIKYKVGKIEQEKEIFRLRNVELAEAHKHIMLQHDQLEQKNKDITDSLRYAKGIQQAILPPVSTLEKFFRESFITYLPKDIVSGDFYWFYANEHEVVVIAGDCTGHGVPGALMSVMANDILNQVVRERKVYDLAEILEEVDKGLKRSMTREHSCNTDGMDLAIMRYKKGSPELEFAGAKRPLWIGKDNQIIEYQGTRRSLEAYQNQDLPFEVRRIPVEPNDVIFLFTDGLPDQIGGQSYKKLKKDGVKRLLTTCLNQPLSKQKDFIENYVTRFKGELEQVDDILLIGMKV